jgi:hypothetical protein
VLCKAIVDNIDKKYYLITISGEFDSCIVLPYQNTIKLYDAVKNQLMTKHNSVDVKKVILLIGETQRFIPLF